MYQRISACLVAGVILSSAAIAVADEGSDRVAAAGTAALGGSQAAMYRIDQKVWDRDTAARDARVKAAGTAAMGGSQSAMYAMDQKMWDRDTVARDARVRAAGTAAMGGSQSAMYAMDPAAAERAMAEAAANEGGPKVAEGTERR